MLSKTRVSHFWRTLERVQDFSIDWIAHHLRAIIHNNMPAYKGPKAEQIALGLGVCAALCGTAYCLHKYISTPRSLPMAEAYEFDIEQQAIDVPVSFE